jgi:hypothetical protein
MLAAVGSKLRVVGRRPEGRRRLPSRPLRRRVLLEGRKAHAGS